MVSEQQATAMGLSTIINESDIIMAHMEHMYFAHDKRISGKQALKHYSHDPIVWVECVDCGWGEMQGLEGGRKTCIDCGGKLYR